MAFVRGLAKSSSIPQDATLSNCTFARGNEQSPSSNAERHAWRLPARAPSSRSKQISADTRQRHAFGGWAPSSSTGVMMLRRGLDSCSGLHQPEPEEVLGLTRGPDYPRPVPHHEIRSPAAAQASLSSPCHPCHRACRWPLALSQSSCSLIQLSTQKGDPSCRRCLRSRLPSWGKEATDRLPGRGPSMLVAPP